MKKFISKICFFLLLFIISALLIICFDVFFIKNQFMGSYQAGLLDKIARLEAIDEPKIVLVGNSNVSFGINSAMLEEELQMPVVNLGLHGGLGNAFHENLAKFAISPGDIIIICHSGYSDNGRINNTEAAWETIELHTELWKALSSEDYFNMIKAYPNYVFKAGIYWLIDRGNEEPAHTSYCRSAFNEYGDIVYRPEDQQYKFTGKTNAPKINDICIDRLNQLNLYVKEKDAVLLVAGYPIGYGNYKPSSEEFECFENELREKLDCEVISTFSDYFYPNEYFYNTASHLTEEGAQIRTEQLIRDLKQWMQKSQ